MRRFTLVLSVACILTFLTASARAAVFCARKNRRTGAPAEGAAVKLRTTCKAAEVAVDPIAPGAVTTGKLATDAVGTGNVVDGAITGAKIADGAISAAKIRDGEVVKGGGSFLTKRIELASGATNVEILAFPGIGILRGSCASGSATTGFTNAAGTDINLQATGVDNGATDAAFVLRNNPSDGATVTVPNGGTGGIQSVEWQAAFTDGTGKTHSVTTWVTMGAALTNCIVTAQALTTN
jgi:hypothetical protein